MQKRYLPCGVMKVVKDRDRLARGICQNPLLASILSLVHNIDAGLSVKTASKAPLYAGAGIEIISIPASASSVNIVNQA